MELTKTAIAGTLESSDIQITLAPSDQGIQINLESDVKKQYGQAIEATMRDILAKYGIENASVAAVDKGALDLVIKARMVTAIERASDADALTAWEVL